MYALSSSPTSFYVIVIVTTAYLFIYPAQRTLIFLLFLSSIISKDSVYVLFFFLNIKIAVQVTWIKPINFVVVLNSSSVLNRRECTLRLILVDIETQTKLGNS